MKLLSISAKRKYICRKNFKKAAGMFPWEQLYRVFPGGKSQMYTVLSSLEAVAGISSGTGSVEEYRLMLAFYIRVYLWKNGYMASSFRKLPSFEEIYAQIFSSERQANNAFAFCSLNILNAAFRLDAKDLYSFFLDGKAPDIPCKTSTECAKSTETLVRTFRMKMHMSKNRPVESPILGKLLKKGGQMKPA